jgi:hypothetical protein
VPICFVLLKSSEVFTGFMASVILELAMGRRVMQGVPVSEAFSPFKDADWYEEAFVVHR